MKHWATALLILIVTLVVSQLPVSSAPGDRVAYPTRPMHDRLSSSVHRKISTAMLLATYSAHGRMSKGDKVKLDTRDFIPDEGRVTYLPTYQAIKSLNIPVTNNFSTGFKFGMNSNGVNGYTWNHGYGITSGYPWSKRLERLEYDIRTNADLGVKVYKTYALFNDYYTLSSEGDDSAIASIGQDSGWEALDHVVHLCRKYGIKLHMAFFYPSPLDTGITKWGYTAGTGVTDYNKFMDYWFLPWATAVATRYAADDDVVQIQPITEYRTLFSNTSTAAQFQAQTYDALKTIAPNLPVILSGAYHLHGMPESQGLVGLLDALDAYNKTDKFDDLVDVHLYPHPQKVETYGRANMDPYVNYGEGGPKDVTSIISKLDAIGRSDAKIRVGEFGLFWELESAMQDYPVTVETSAQDIIDTYNIFKNNPRVDSVLYWNFWGIKGPTRVSGISAAGQGVVRDESGVGKLYEVLNTGVIASDNKLSVNTTGPKASLHVNHPDPDGNVADVGSLLYGTASGIVGSTQNNSFAAELIVADNTNTPGYKGIMRGVRARGSLASPTAPSVDDDVFAFQGAIFDGRSTAHNTARVAFVVDGAVLPTSAPQRISMATRSRDGVAWNERLTVKSDGKVGIGNTSPSELLDVNGTVQVTTLKFSGDGSTLTKAIKSSPPNLTGYVQLSSGGGFTHDTGFYYVTDKLTAEDFALSEANPTFLTDDYTTTGLNTAPSSTIFKGLSDRIPVMTAGSIPFSNGTIFTQDNANLFFDDATNRLGIGTAAPTQFLDIYSATAGAAMVIRDEATSATGGGSIQLRHSNASSTYAASGDRLGLIRFGSRAGTTNRNGVDIVSFAEETFGTGAGSNLQFHTTPIGGTTPTEKLRVASSGLVTYSNGGGPPFGHQYFNDITGLTITVGAADTWYEIDGAGTTFTAGQLKNVTQSDHYLVATTAGYYKADYCVSVDTTAAGDEIAATVAVNGTASVTAHSHSTVAAGNSASTVCGTTILNLAANDQVSIVVENHTAARNVIVHHAQLGLDYKGAP